MSPRASALLGVVAVLACTFALYGPGLGGGLIWDDFGYLFAFGRTFADVGWFEALQWFWVPRPEFQMGTYRPVLELSYVYEWRLWETWVPGYRLTNLLLHAGCALLLGRLVHALGGGTRAAWLASVLFALSPAHPESCLWLSSRVNLLATLFMLAALLLAARGKNALVALCAFAALGSKETAFALPPALFVLALVRADGGFGRRVVSALRATWLTWLAFVVYLALRHHVLGTFGGGYAWREPPDVLSLAYLRERAELVLVLLSPVNLARNPAFMRVVLVVAHAALLLGVAWTALRGAPPLRAACRFVLAWLLLSFVPIYNAPFSPGTVTQMESSRLLYDPTAALIVGIALAAFVRSTVLAVPLVLMYTLVAWANAGPWLETESASAAVDEAVRDARAAPAGERWVVDLPLIHDGAFLYPAQDPVLVPMIHGEVSAQRVELRRATQFEQVLRRIDAHVQAQRADGFELWCARVAARGVAVIEREAIDTRFPLAASADVTVRYARVATFDPRAGRELEVDALLELRGGASLEPLIVNLHDAADRRIGSYIRSAGEREGVQALRFTLPVRADAEAGDYTVALQLGATRVVLCSVAIAGARWWR